MRSSWQPLLVALLFIFLPLALADEVEAPEQRPMLKAGDPAPDFAIPPTAGAEEDGPRKLSDYRGRSVLISFFPKVFSLGCTRQLTEYAEEYGVFEDSETDIIAISGDPQSESLRFRERHGLPFPVVGDPDHRIIDEYGVPSRTYLGVLYPQRCVFLVGPDGIIRYVEMNYSVLRSKDALYEAVKSMADSFKSSAIPVRAGESELVSKPSP